MLQEGLPPEILSVAVMKKLCAYSWPGNIRELRNVLERALLLARGGPIGLEHFSGIVPGSGPKGDGSTGEAITPLKRLEREHLERTVRECGGNTKQAAAKLGLPLSTFYRKIRKPHHPA